MDGFFVGACFSAIVAFSLWLNVDINATSAETKLSTGNELCSSFGGLESFDFGGDFICKNEVLLKDNRTNKK